MEKWVEVPARKNLRKQKKQMMEKDVKTSDRPRRACPEAVRSSAHKACRGSKLRGHFKKPQEAFLTWRTRPYCSGSQMSRSRI